MTGERLPDERLQHWLEQDPTQIWFCNNCHDFHTPDWNCIKGYKTFPGKPEIDEEVKQIMKVRGF